MLKNSFLLLLLIVSLASCDFTSHEEYYNQAILYEKRGEYKEALYYMNKAIQKKPEDRQALSRRAYYHSLLGNDSSNIADSKRILQFDPDNTMTLYNLGIAHELIDEYREASEYYTKALESKYATVSDTTSGNVRLELRGVYEDRDSDYTVPKVKILAKRGYNYLLDEKYDEAIADLQYILEAKYSESYAYHYLGMAYLGKKDSIQACQNLIEAAKLGSKVSREKLKEHCI